MRLPIGMVVPSVRFIIDGQGRGRSMLIHGTGWQFTYMNALAQDGAHGPARPAVKSAVRTLRIMELFATSARPLALGEVAAALAIPKSSAHMLVGTLLAEGYLEETAPNRYALPEALERGWVGGATAALVRAAAPEMDRLLEQFQETVVLGVPTPALDVHIVAHRTSPLAVRYDVSRDPAIPGWCTAMGHAILSHLPEDEVGAYLDRTNRIAATARTVTDKAAILARLGAARARGHALNIDERFEGASGAAVAILDPHGRPRAALNIVTVTPRFRRRQRAIVAGLKAAARAIESTLHGRDAGPRAAAGRES